MEFRQAFDFSGKVAVVTGGSGVLCGALARTLGNQGAAVAVLAGSRLDRASTAAEEIVAAGGQAAHRPTPGNNGITLAPGGIGSSNNSGEIAFSGRADFSVM